MLKMPREGFAFFCFFFSKEGIAIQQPKKKISTSTLISFPFPSFLSTTPRTYADAVGPENAAKYQTLVFLAGSASAEFFADIGLCPFEAVKVKVQTVPGFARGLSDGMPKFIATEGIGGLYKGLTPLWGRQIPYTMMKFAAFENTVMVSFFCLFFLCFLCFRGREKQREGERRSDLFARFTRCPARSLASKEKENQKLKTKKKRKKNLKKPENFNNNNTSQNLKTRPSTSTSSRNRNPSAPSRSSSPSPSLRDTSPVSSAPSSPTLPTTSSPS